MRWSICGITSKYMRLLSQNEVIQNGNVKEFKRETHVEKSALVCLLCVYKCSSIKKITAKTHLPEKSVCSQYYYIQYIFVLPRFVLKKKYI